MSFKPINSPRFITHTAESFDRHLKDIVNHTARLKRKRAAAAKERSEFTKSFQPKPRAWSYRTSPKGNPVITIRNRDPKYLLKSEVEELIKENSVGEDVVLKYLAKKKIEVRHA